jgi:hypothetical protein
LQSKTKEVKTLAGFEPLIRFEKKKGIGKVPEIALLTCSQEGLAYGGSPPFKQYVALTNVIAPTTPLRKDKINYKFFSGRAKSSW